MGSNDSYAAGILILTIELWYGSNDSYAAGILNIVHELVVL